MKKEEIFGKEDISFINQLMETLEEAGLELKEAYNKKNYENFNKSKKLILRIKEKISDMTK